MSALWGRVLSSIKTKIEPTAVVYNLTMGSWTSSRYRTAVTGPRLKMCRENLDSLVNMALPQPDTVQIPCSRHHLNRAPLDWTDRGTQIRGTRAYTPFICNLRRTVASDIALPMDAVTIDVTRVEVALQFCLATIAIYRSSAGLLMNAEEKSNICDRLSCFNAPHSTPGFESSIRFLEIIETQRSNCGSRLAGVSATDASQLLEVWCLKSLLLTHNAARQARQSK
ncbi:uncharacterized protein TNCV_1708621 [Trichonephila clavipes]|nr:uncharacterized protein TNCV_1708621 [Trichonephila clavipes]